MKNNETDNFNFNSFSDLEFYKKVNSNLLDLADLNSSNKIVHKFWRNTQDSNFNISNLS